MRRWLLGLSIALVILVALASGGVYAFLRRSLPQTDGTIALYAHAITGDIPESLCPNNNVFLTGTALSGPIWTQPEAGS